MFSLIQSLFKKSNINEQTSKFIIPDEEIARPVIKQQYEYSKPMDLLVENEEIREDLDVVKTKHPRIFESINSLWGKSDLQDHLLNLVLMEKNDRQGFSQPVASALIKIYNFHMKKFNLEANISCWGVDKCRW